MKLRNDVKRLLVLLTVLWVTTGIGLAQNSGQSYNSASGVNGGPVSGSDQQVQAAELLSKRGQQKVDLFTGSFGYSIPIACAPARNGSEPNLALAYSSAEENGWCGMGWKLEIGSIERFTRDGFPIAYSTATNPAPLTRYDDTKGFMLNLSGKGYKLFSVATNVPVIEYRTEVDTELLRCLLNTNNNNWTIYDKSGDAWYLGETTNSRVTNPKTGWSGYSGTFHWALDQIVTASGDWTTLVYTNYTSPYTGLPERILYPLQIAYNGHTNLTGYSANFPGPDTITFQTTLRPNDWGFSFRSGFRTDQTRQLTNILCQVGTQNVWSYGLHYGISPATARSILTNVVLYGYANGGGTATAYLTNSFAYQANPNGVSFGPTIVWTNLSLPALGQSGNNPDVTQVSENESDYGYTIADLIDMDGDGLPDRVAYNPGHQPNQYIVQKNLGMQFNGSGRFSATNLFGSSSTANATWSPSAAYTASATNPIPDADLDVAAWSAMNTGYGRLRDINGDGLPDKVMGYWKAIASQLPGVTATPFTNYAVMLNTGQGFTNENNWPVSTGPLALTDANSAAYYCVESGGPMVGFFDINGDGRPDRVMAYYYSPTTNFLVQFNTGTNFTQPMLFGPYHSQYWSGAAGQSSLPYNWAGIETPEAHMIDLNGDGLPDRVMYPLNSGGSEMTHPASYYAVEYNDGYSFESTNTSTGYGGASDQWPGVVNQTSSATSASGITFYPDAIMDLPFGGMFDLNGDGLPDRVVVDGASLATTQTVWYVYLNNGHGFNTTSNVVTNIANQGHSSSIDGYPYWSMQGADSVGNLLTTLIDINGDGLLDRVMSVYGNAAGLTLSNYFLVQLNQGPFPDLLTNVNNGIGGVISVTYNPSTAYDNRVDPTNTNSVSHMPYPRQVTASVAESDGVNPLQTTSYGYGGGYYDGVRREFHGFAVVTNTDPTLRSTVTYFHTGGGRNYAALGEYQDTNSTNGAGNFPKAGMAYRVETYGNDGELYHVQINQVDQTSLGNARYFPFTTLSFDCDYPGNGTPIVTATQFTYDTNENVITKTEFGQVTNFNPASVGTFTFTDIAASDTRNFNTTYATIGSSSYIVDHPATAILADANSNTVQETDYSYNSSSGTLAAKLTRISASSFATNGYGYNTYGMVGLTTNAAGVQTTVIYDSAYNTYPATTTVGSFVTTTSYDSRSGQLAASTDPAGLTVSNSFDVFLRPTETDLIPIGSSTVVWQKKFDYPAVLQAIASGVAVNYVDEVQNDGVGGSTNRTYIDGFGRPIQTSTQGENGNFRVVSTAYDGRGNAFLTTWPIFGTITFTKPATTGLSATLIGYDAAGRVATNVPVSVTFNSNGAFSSASALTGDSGSPLGARTWSYVNGSNPWWIKYTDEDGQIRFYGLDAFGRTNQILEVDGTSTYTNFLKYDLANNLTNLVNANAENIWWAYNQAGGLVAMADPYLGQWTYLRDYAGRLRVQTDARGDVVSNSYINPSTGGQDALGRLQVQTVYSTNYISHTLIPAFTNSYFYDTNADPNYTVYPGQVYEVIDSQGYEKTGYDSRARTVKTARYLNINGSTNITSFTFDDGNNVASTAYPSPGPTITNSYFHGGSINQVSLGSSYHYYTISASGYDQFGHATNFTYGNGVTTARGYYPQSQRLKSITAAGSSGTVFSRTYGYSAGNDITNLNGTGLTNAVTVSYYNLHRIKSYSGISGGTNYGYDPTGNITTNSEGGGSRYAYANPRIQAVRTAFGYTNLYDLCGNMIVRHGGLTNSQALVYDPENRLSAIAQSGVMSDEFGYAFDGTRLWKRLNQNPTNIQVWIGNIYEQKGGKNLFHVFANGEQVCTFETNSFLYGGTSTNVVGDYYHQDSLTSSSVLSSGSTSATQTEVNVWYPFGRIQTASPQASFQVSRRFTGQVFDTESGLYYYNARYFDPELGRFIQPDTIISDLSNPQSYNRYSYCLNDPLAYNDPSGHVSTLAVILGLGDSEATSEADAWAKTVRNTSGNLQGYASFADARRQLAEQKDPMGINADVRFANEQSGNLRGGMRAAAGMAKLEINVESSIVAPEATVEEAGGATAAEKLETTGANNAEEKTGMMPQLAQQAQGKPIMTQWGWQNSPSWRAAANEIGTAAHNSTIMDLGGKIPTQSEAETMIASQGGKVIRAEPAHPEAGVSTHTFPHINYQTSNGSRATIRVQEVAQ
jgi:RHS repeat-associated protein